MKELTLVFLVTDKKVLLAMKKRGFGAGRWNGVGGKVDGNESIEQAMIRECQEEVSVTPLTYSKTAEILFHEVMAGIMTDMRVHVYLCTEWRGEPIESEEMAPQWFAQSEIPYDAMWPDDPFWLPQVLAGQTLKANFSTDEQDVIVEQAVVACDPSDFTT